MPVDLRRLTYRYFALAEITPVRVVYNESGLKVGAEAPDPATQRLEINFHMLHRVEQSPEVEEIDQAAFEALCERVYSRKQ